MIKLSGAPIGLILIGAFIFIFGALMLYQSTREANYFAIQGLVTQSEIKKIVETQPGSKTSSVSWKLYVDYEYTIENTVFSNNVVSSGSQTSNAAMGQEPSKKLKNLISVYQPGKSVTVYVSPKSPKNSVLIRSSYDGIWWIIASFCFFVGAFYLIKKQS